MDIKQKAAPSRKVENAEWVWIALDGNGSRSERAWRLGLECGHAVFRRVSWAGVKDPDRSSAPSKARCEICAGRATKHRLVDDVRREVYQALREEFGP